MSNEKSNAEIYQQDKKIRAKKSEEAEKKKLKNQINTSDDLKHITKENLNGEICLTRLEMRKDMKDIFNQAKSQKQEEKREKEQDKEKQEEKKQKQNER